jgi:hypothetical protein
MVVSTSPIIVNKQPKTILFSCITLYKKYNSFFLNKNFNKEEVLLFFVKKTQSLPI